jgi:CubicO group peptidase (beta-lactamase class C family)
VWEGRQVIPGEYVKRMPAESVDTSSAAAYGQNFTHGYGLGVWLTGDGTFRMDGAYGQYAIVAPEHRAAITVTAHSANDVELLDAIYDLVLKRL